MSRWLVAVMTGILFVAIVVAVTGFVTLFTDARMLHGAQYGSFLGPLMVACSAVLVAVVCGTGTRRRDAVVTVLVAVAGTYLVMLGVGAVGSMLVLGDVTQLILFPASYAFGPFVVSAVVSALISVGVGLVLGRVSPGPVVESRTR